MNAVQEAEYRDSVARMKLATHAARLVTAREAEQARPKRPRRTKLVNLAPLSAPTDAPTAAQAELAARLAPHICADSVIDRAEHALGVARMILNQPSGVRRAVSPATPQG